MSHSLQLLPQLLAGTLHPHLERRDPGPRDFRHLLVAQLLDVLQHEGLPVLDRQELERPFDPLEREGIDDPIQIRQSTNQTLVPIEPLLTAPAPRREGPALVHDDLSKPRAEPLAIAALAKPPVRPHESRLQRIVRVISVAEHAHREPVLRILVTPNQFRERSRLTIEYRPDECTVGSIAHTLKTTASV